MTIAQIIIYSLLASLDVCLIVAHVRKYDIWDEVSKRELAYVGHLIRFLLTWAIIAASTLEMNRLSSPNPCPQLEKVENVYKIKP